MDCWTVGYLEIRTIELWTVGPFDYNLIKMDDHAADSCAISPTTFMFFFISFRSVVDVVSGCSVVDAPRGPPDTRTLL